jgi:predicted signal transduction protein with EAL and GGDEF domain
LPAFRPDAGAVGKRLDVLWPDSAASQVMHLTRKAIALRDTIEGRFFEGGYPYEARVSPKGPDRALCVIRTPLTGQQAEGVNSSGPHPGAHLDRRGFLRRFHESMSWAALREEPLAVAVIHVDGIADIAQLIGTTVAEQILSTAILRLSGRLSETAAMRPDGQRWWYLGQLSESLLAVVLESSDRQAIQACVSDVCASLREPVSAGEAEFHLTVYAGVALLGRDASSPRALLDHARAASAEARRAGSTDICFFTENVSQRQLARLDSARELRDAIANRDVRLRYVGRHDLATGRLVAWVGYLRWLHPLRGEIRPVEFLRLAETTGLATELSRAALSCPARRLREAEPPIRSRRAHLIRRPPPSHTP